MMNNGGRIINISSGMGQLDDMEVVHSVSFIKTVLNALTKILSRELLPKGIKVTQFAQVGFKSDMGGQNATLTVKISF